MSILPHLSNAVRAVDETIAAACLAVKREESALLSFVFHGLFCDEGEIHRGAADPQQGITLAMFRAFISHFRGQGYKFISPPDLLQALPAGGRYLLLTFDDGYYNHQRALPVLEEFGVPAVFFISSGHVRRGRAFWWDVAFRELAQRGENQLQIRREVGRCKRLKTAEVEARFAARFGEPSLRPVGDLDRPFDPAELHQFARHPLVFLGNHTRDHAILTNYSRAEAMAQIQGGQEDIREMTGQTPLIISYPNGACSWEVIELARRAGLKLGMGAAPGRNRLPLQANSAMEMRRFMIWGNREIEPQCKASRAAVSIQRTLLGIRRKAQRGLSY